MLPFANSAVTWFETAERHGCCCWHRALHVCSRDLSTQWFTSLSRDMWLHFWIKLSSNSNFYLTMDIRYKHSTYCKGITIFPQCKFEVKWGDGISSLHESCNCAIVQDSCDHVIFQRSRRFVSIMWPCKCVICYVIQVICKNHVIMWSCDCDSSASYAIQAICELWIAIKKMMHKMMVLFSIF